MKFNDTVLLERIRGAVARGWCSSENSSKIIDIELAEAISFEVFKELPELMEVERMNSWIPTKFEIEGMLLTIHSKLQSVKQVSDIAQELDDDLTLLAWHIRNREMKEIEDQEEG